MAKILLINAINIKNDITSRPFPPLGLGYIASYISKYNNVDEIKIVDGSTDISELITEFAPSIIGISSTTPEFNYAVGLADKIKDANDIPIVVGGHHITALPQCLPDSMDIGVIGEGEQTFAEIVQAHEDTGLSKGVLSNIKGIVYRRDGEVVINPKRELIQHLDDIPFPARNLMGINSEWTHLLTSRGCPYKCRYCAAGSFWGTVRFHSPERVVNEIKHLYNTYNITRISIEDDLFIAKKSRVREIAQLIQKEGLDKVMKFSCLCQAKLVDEEILEYLKAMNIWHVSLGFESGSEQVLRDIKKRSVSVEDNRNAIQLIKKYHIKVRGFFMIGAPGETKEDMIKTLDFIRSNQLDSARISVMVPFPGTDMWEYAKARGLVSDNMNWDVFNMNFEDNCDNYPGINDSVCESELRDIYFKIKTYLDLIDQGTVRVNDFFSLQKIWRGIKAPRKFVRAIRIVYSNLISNFRSQIAKFGVGKV